MYAYWIVVNYRESYGMFACNGILFNHESPLRGETFITKKVVDGLCNIKHGLQKTLYLGNLNARRDWGHAKDLFECKDDASTKEPDDFVIATGKQYSVREFIAFCRKTWNFIRINGKNEDEYAVVSDIRDKDINAIKNGDIIVRIDPRYYRPAEVELCLVIQKS